MSLSSPPVASPIQDSKAIATVWKNWFQEVFNNVNANAQSGPTSSRPTKNLFVGQMFFDTTLHIPIWYKGTVWINAAGTTV